MSEFYLCHIALVGARMSAFQEYGFNTRNDLSMCRVAPRLPEGALEQMDRGKARKLLAGQLPLWVHNIIVDPEFPLRQELAMPLRRFEGELNDSKDNEVIAAVLTAGFKSRTLDPTALPASMPMRQRCTMVVHSGAWQEAYSRLETDMVDIMMANLAEITQWVDYAGRPGHQIIEYSESA